MGRRFRFQFGSKLSHFEAVARKFITVVRQLPFAALRRSICLVRHSTHLGTVCATDSRLPTPDFGHCQAQRQDRRFVQHWD